ncbi:hypothetical protein SAMN05216553_104412 [Lentzea fradiae]|uniref:Uncharacterized protein n=1 Tax=Lentzea fradiae TaxID=200378 RepID=A0A1G7QF22_9PSEU|nr:hypothetical protein SAMN05216553_104412 [Lentzea fradiae]
MFGASEEQVRRLLADEEVRAGQENATGADPPGGERAGPP